MSTIFADFWRYGVIHTVSDNKKGPFWALYENRILDLVTTYLLLKTKKSNFLRKI